MRSLVPYQEAMHEAHTISETESELELTVNRCAAAAVTAAATLLERGAALDDLVAVLSDTEQETTVTVGPAAELLAETPDLMLHLRLNRSRVPAGYLAWIALVGGSIAWGAFSVVPDSRIDA